MNTQQLTPKKWACALFFILLSASFSFGQINVSTTVTWSSTNLPPSGYTNGINIVSGGHLSIDGITLSMASGAKITLKEANCSFHAVNLATIQGATATATWGGIEVDASDPLIYPEQFSVWPDYEILNSPSAWSGTLNPNFPSVRIDNSTIKNAVIGVNSIAGGVIRTRSAHFINNQIAIQINPYESSAWLHSPDYDNCFKNACYFMDTEFTVDNAFQFSTSIEYIGINLLGVKGINIGGCTFKNDMTAKLCPLNRGTGIKARKAKFSVDRSGNLTILDGVGCNSNGYSISSPGPACSFSKLSTAIDFASDEDYSFVARYAIFNTNYRGILVDGTGANPTWVLATAYECTFTSLRTDLDNIFGDQPGDACYLGSPDIIDISLKTVRSEIYKNAFTFTGKEINHIKVESSGPNNFGAIRFNTFTNMNSATVSFDGVIGIQAIGNNSSVIVSCNTFKDLGTDIKLNPGATLVNPMRGTNANDEANNTFSNVLLNRKRVDNTLNPSLGYRVTNPVQNAENPNFGGASVNVTNNNLLTDEVLGCVVTCEAMAQEVDFPLFLDPNIDEGNILIFPNPSSGKFNIESEKSKLSGVLVFNSLGQLVCNFKIEDNNQFSLDVSFLSEGIYYITVSTEDGKKYAEKLLLTK